MKSTLAQELDFENEGRNGERCYRELKPLSYIHVPAIYWDKTSKVRQLNTVLYLAPFTYMLIQFQPDIQASDRYV
jgi:ABC1 atypical kinase-like domain